MEPNKEFERIKSSDALFVLPAEIAKVLELSPQGIRNQARSDPDKLGFPVVVCGNKVKIPRLSFIQFVENGRQVCET